MSQREDFYDVSQDPFCPYCHDNDMTVEIDGSVLWACLKCDSTFTAHGTYSAVAEGEVVSLEIPGRDDGEDILPEPRPNALTRITRAE